jgi:hypothetical protein
MNRFLILLCVMALGACGQYSIRNIDKPAPKSYEGWLKPDGSSLPINEARRALLECGAPSPEITSFVYEKAMGLYDEDDKLRDSFEITGCMEKAGFKRRWTSQKKDCSLYPRYAQFPACQPNATFRTRSVERRLNSWYCKLETDRDYCRKHAFTPSACDDPKEDYNNPPAICRP